VRPRFFVDLPAPTLGPVAPGLVVALDDTDARHARTVLRSRSGDPCELAFSDPDVLAEAVFVEVGGRVTARVTGVSIPRPRGVRLLLVQALPQPRKVDEVIEKGTEVGFDSFLVVPTLGSPDVPRDKLEGRVMRWRAVAREAAKQSRQPAVPEVRTAPSLKAALELTQEEGWAAVVLTPGAESHLGDVLGAAGRGIPGAGDSEGAVRWAVWVGPEGGWTSEEVDTLRAGGARVAGLGSRVLRTETAGPVAGALARYVLSDW
jgi:16S rRNA (uracil1498-N3)-methyltransferase